MEEPRVIAFRILRPPCVELSQITLKHKVKKASGQEVVKALERVYSTLQQVAKTSNALDSKLADYVFFPLSHIFRDVKDLSTRAVELALQCLHVLISQGWRDQMPAQMGKQLLILLSFIVGGSHQETKVKDVQEELGVAAFDCLASLFSISDTAGLSDDGGLIATENVPLLGHSVTIMLDGILDGTSGVRSSALYTLRKVVEGIRDREALRNVLPGTVSTVTKVLSPKSTSIPSSEIIVNGIDVLKMLLVKAIADVQMQDPSFKTLPSTNEASPVKTSDAWTEATAGQVRMALVNIIPLRYHDKKKVRIALSRLCEAIIQDCRVSLNQSIPMLVETLVILSNESSEEIGTSFEDVGFILAADVGLLDILRNSLHDWIIAMPRIMQSNDDGRKARMIDQVSTAFRILELQGINLDLLTDLMAANLQSSVSAAIQADSSHRIAPAPEDSLAVSQILRRDKENQVLPSFGPVLFQASHTSSSVFGLQKLAHQLQSRAMPTKIQQSFADTLRATSEGEQLASLWLSLQMLSTSPQNDVTEQYLDLPAVSAEDEPLLDDVYSFALEILSKSTFEDSEHWQLQSLCLEVIALQARHQKAEFRPELVDTLYPILERLGSSNSILQSHALTCLSIVSASCAYAGPAALIIDNADYLVNAISLKLNTFDISPQAPQVLVMMITLCGSTLIPYLDDLVESIFSILAMYHGYPKLVESLFTVLNAIVEQAAKSNDKAIDYRPDGITKPHYFLPRSINDVADLLHTSRETKPPPEETDPNPQNPETIPSTTTDDINPPPPPSPSKTFTLIHSIVTLTPAHLTSPSPPLRSNLLTLLTTALPLLASNADTILPLAATLFPLISTRLFSTLTSSSSSSSSSSSPPPPPPYETLAAARTMSTLLTCAGTFLYSRTSDALWWGKLRNLYVWAEGGMMTEERERGIGITRRRRRGGQGGMRWRIWDQVMSLLLGLVTDVGVSSGTGGESGGGEGDEGQEKGVFEMLGPWSVRSPESGRGKGGGFSAREKERTGRGSSEKIVRREADGDVRVDWNEAMDDQRRKEVKEVLEMLNPDFMWLYEERCRVARGGKGLEKPKGVEGREFRDLRLD